MEPKKSGVIGWPISHSLSPKVHGYWLKKYAINGEYNAYPVGEDALEAFLATMTEKGFSGCNVTLPHKEEVLRLLNVMGHVSEEAGMIGAVNTIIVQKDGTLMGRNTDAYGFIENIRPSLPARKDKAVILGAGGAAKAVIYALLQAGFKTLIVTNRTQERADRLAGLFPHVTAKPWGQRGEYIEDADLLVNTTSLGMTGKESLDIDFTLLPKQALVTDIVYAPLMTPLLAQSKVRGNPVVDGLGMLLHQAVPGFEAWFGVRPVVDEALRNHILGA